MVGPWLAGSRLAQLTRLLSIAAQCGLCELVRGTKRLGPLGRATAVCGSYCWPREVSVCGYRAWQGYVRGQRATGLGMVDDFSSVGQPQ